MNAPWHELLDLAGRGQLELLGLRVRDHLAALKAQRPEPEPLEPYGRRLLHRSEIGEVLLAGWRQGCRSAPHDHGNAAGLVLLLEGRFEETRYDFAGDRLRRLDTRRYEPFSCLRAAPGVIHDMRATDFGMSLHFYLPAICTMRVYDAQARATLLVGEACGAWLPRRRELIHAYASWNQSTRAGR